ncbi:MAG TPA: hypothetical protein VNK95_03280 [Caldilineaceae bacterium]|nr:hypothetical protein [Caldilineaceae bacterium]
MLAAVDGMLQALGLLQRPFDHHEYAATLAAVRAQAPPDLFARAWQEGQRWSRAQVLACVGDAFDA